MPVRMYRDGLRERYMRICFLTSRSASNRVCDSRNGWERGWGSLWVTKVSWWDRLLVDESVTDRDCVCVCVCDCVNAGVPRYTRSVTTAWRFLSLRIAQHGPQIWRVAATIFNKQSQTSDRWRNSTLGFARGPKVPHSKKKITRHKM